MMNFEEYASVLEIAIANGDNYDDIKIQYREELSYNEQEQLEQLESELLGKYKNKIKKSETLDEYFYNLSVKDSISGLSLWDGKIPFGKWLAEIYIPEFHTLKAPEIQSPIAACLMLLNGNLYERDNKGIGKTEIPKVMCLGFPGSGKTTYSEQLLEFHNPRTTIDSRNSTEIAIIDAVDLLNKSISGFTTPPVTLLLDNLDKDIRNDFEKYKPLLLFQTPREASRSVSKRSSNLEESNGTFNYYSYVISTTVFDLRPLAKSNPYYDQIVSRCIYLMFEKSDNYKNLDFYDWGGFASIYKDIWNDKDNITKYYETLKQFPASHTDYNFPSLRAYKISRMPMATGVVSGVYDSSIDALYSFSDYWQSLDKLIDVIKDEKIELIRTYVNLIHREKIQNEERQELIKREKFPEWEKREIKDSFNRKDIDEYLSKECGVRLGEKLWDSQIPQLLRSLGYVRDETVRGYVFIKK